MDIGAYIISPRDVAIERTKRELELFFERDPRRFHVEGVIGVGAHGVTLKVIDLEPATQLAPAITGTKRKRVRVITPTELAGAIRSKLSISSARSAILGAARRLERVVKTPRGIPVGHHSRSPSPLQPYLFRNANVKTLSLKRSRSQEGNKLLRKEIETLQVQL